MAVETEKQAAVLKTSAAVAATAAVPRPKRKRSQKPKSAKKLVRAAPGREEGLRQRRWRFNGVGFISVVAALVCLWAAFFASGENQKLGQDGLRQLIAVSVFFAVGSAAKPGNPK